MKSLLKEIDREHIVMGPPKSRSPDPIKVEKKEIPAIMAPQEIPQSKVVPESNLKQADLKNMFQDTISEKPKNIPVLKKKYQRVKKSPSPKSIKSSKIVGKKRPKLSDNIPESPAEEPPFGQLSQKSSSKCVSSKAGIPKTIQKRQLKEQ